MSFKVVPANIKGADFEINNFSIVSRYYQREVDNGELKIGDTIICADSDFDWSPLVLKYDLYIVKGRNGHKIDVIDQNGNIKSIEAGAISYIVRGN